MDAIGEADSWNKNLLYVKYGQVVGELASIAAGFALKGPQGIIVSLGIGIAGGGSEWFVLEQFYDALEEVTKLQPEVESACLEASQDPSITDKDCDDDDDGNGGDEDDGHDGIPGYSNGLGICEEPQYPICARPTIDPAGYVYEAVASNRIEGATAKIYYEGDDGEEVYWDDAEEYGEINPQTTDTDGRFAWMTPIGNWRVKVEKDGYEDADSKNDPAAVDGWLPVPPPQLDVNIAMTSTAAPTVLSAGAVSDQIRVVFSQYMDIAQMEEGLVTVTQNGQPISVDILFEDAEVSPTNSAAYYGRILKLTRADGTAFSGDGIVVTVDKTAKNYAGTQFAEKYVSDPMAAAQLIGSLSHSYPNRFVTNVGKTEQIAVQVLDTKCKPMAGVTVTARQKVGGTLEMNESAVSDVSGRAVFTVKGLSAGSDVILFAADVVSTEMNTRVSPLGSTVPQKPEANLSDYAVVEEGTQLILTYPGTEDVVIYYTTNNTCPCSDENDRKIYDGPVTITEDTFFRIAAWTEAGGYSERLNLHITIKKNIHLCKDNLTKVGAKRASCTENGNIDYYQCSCGKWFEDEGASVEITDKDSVVIKAGHTYGALIEEVPAIHTAAELKAGMLAHYFCDECDTYFTEGKVATTLEALIVATPEHSYGDWIITDGEQHWKACACGLTTEVGAHIYDGDRDTTCDTCGHERVLAHEHTFADTLSYDANNHWHASTCGHDVTSGMEPHHGGIATCKAQAVCEVCGQSYGAKNLNNHTETLQWIQTPTTHKQTYTCCGTVVITETNHNWGENKVCTECHYGCIHTYGDPVFAWQPDFSAAKASQTCGNCGGTKTVTCVIESLWNAKSGTLTFTATAEGGFTDAQTMQMAVAGGKLTITNSAAEENEAVDMLIMVAGYTGGQMTGCQVIQDVTGVTEIDLTVSGERKVFFLRPGTYAPLFVCAEL